MNFKTTYLLFAMLGVLLLAVGLMRWLGPSPVDPAYIMDDLQKAKEAGADYVFNTKDPQSPYYVKDLKQAIADVTHGALADRAIVPTSANEAFEQAIDITGNAAILVHFGLPNTDDVIHVPALATHTMDKEIRFSWLAPLAWPTAIRMIAEGLVDLEGFVSSTVPLEETGKAIRHLRERANDPVKVQVAP
uniref:Alcohol dehydrogenase-like C-terminal domain-containing protein n=1 Tax=Gracilinema caldarium TaxID=215591 RepID=A0A7C3I1M2_9SPIR